MDHLASHKLPQSEFTQKNITSRKPWKQCQLRILCSRQCYCMNEVESLICRYLDETNPRPVF